MIPYLETLDAVVYRKSQYPNLLAARAAHATRGIESLNGYTATLDALISIQRVADLMDHRAAENDLVFCVTCNGEELQPMFLIELVEYVANNYSTF